MKYELEIHSISCHSKNCSTMYVIACETCFNLKTVRTNLFILYRPAQLLWRCRYRRYEIVLRNIWLSIVWEVRGSSLRKFLWDYEHNFKMAVSHKKTLSEIPLRSTTSEKWTWCLETKNLKCLHFQNCCKTNTMVVAVVILV